MWGRQRTGRLAIWIWLVAGVGVVPGAGGADPFAAPRNRMVDEEIVAAGVKHARVIQAMRQTPRHEFVPLKDRELAYVDMALPIGHGQTISPPFIVAYMTESLDPQPEDVVLEIGTGSGYQAAVLSPLVRDVYTIEIVESLGKRAAATLGRLKQYANVHTRIGDGFAGWADAAPFDKIIVTCSPENVPPTLVEQLREGGRMVIPIGERYQQTLYLLRKQEGKLVQEALQPTLFVPMTGAAEAGRKIQPDGGHPTIENGGFEESAGEPAAAVAWHYQRQTALESEMPPEGRQFLRLKNDQPGRASQVLQGLAIDGRQVMEVEFVCWLKGEGIRAGQNAEQLPVLAVTFYDELRAEVGRDGIGPLQGSFAWREFHRKLRVPPRAREAIVFIGLGGAVGTFAVDDVRLTVTHRK